MHYLTRLRLKLCCHPAAVAKVRCTGTRRACVFYGCVAGSNVATGLDRFSSRVREHWQLRSGAIVSPVLAAKDWISAKADYWQIQIGPTLDDRSMPCGSRFSIAASESMHSAVLPTRSTLTAMRLPLQESISMACTSHRTELFLRPLSSPTYFGKWNTNSRGN